jgi:hypothetical protein
VRDAVEARPAQRPRLGSISMPPPPDTPPATVRPRRTCLPPPCEVGEERRGSGERRGEKERWGALTLALHR